MQNPGNQHTREEFEKHLEYDNYHFLSTSREPTWSEDGTSPEGGVIEEVDRALPVLLQRNPWFWPSQGTTHTLMKYQLASTPDHGPVSGSDKPTLHRNQRESRISHLQNVTLIRYDGECEVVRQIGRENVCGFVMRAQTSGMEFLHASRSRHPGGHRRLLSVRSSAALKSPTSGLITHPSPPLEIQLKAGDSARSDSCLFKVGTSKAIAAS
jgi:hypothetical protein